ncbi:MAG: LysM peptidoglycan-binding domain-containing protein [Candidatus Paraimprobicoccus trichonymphae]|uniref:LysM peptidoglycan-binding domain-containing protein n=1 Tax=Candidatus Paraimprobicoccus trichonymphae TaxID=3033793 RepID=A0AA48HZI4_9FIRM|nr:MAG: LysM peptidoglycan-binding domain-containing protein [Candidatus Paraimprobicoccus trichonymphae]
MINNYIQIAKLFSSELIKVTVSYKNKKIIDKNMYIINKIAYKKETVELFKRLRSIFFGQDKLEDFIEFFISNNNFYCIFRYKDAESINLKYDKKILTSVFEERTQILELILVKIELLKNLPKEILACITKPENIQVDLEKKIYIKYNFQDIFKNDKNLNLDDVISKNIHDIIFTIFQKESQNKYNVKMQMILDKCKNKIYESIPELIIDFKNSEKSIKNSGIVSYIKTQIFLRKYLIKKYTNLAIILAVTAGLSYLVYIKLNEGNKPADSIKLVSIGGINYTADIKDDSKKNIILDGSYVSQTIDTHNIPELIISSDSDIDFEDHVVKQTDTLDSICDEYYGTTDYKNSVLSFNNIENQEDIKPGNILKLPDILSILEENFE